MKWSSEVLQSEMELNIKLLSILELRGRRAQNETDICCTYFVFLIQLHQIMQILHFPTPFDHFHPTGELIS